MTEAAALIAEMELPDHSHTVQFGDGCWVQLEPLTTPHEPPRGRGIPSEINISIRHLENMQTLYMELSELQSDPDRGRVDQWLIQASEKRHLADLRGHNMSLFSTLTNIYSFSEDDLKSGKFQDNPVVLAHTKSSLELAEYAGHLEGLISERRPAFSNDFEYKRKLNSTVMVKLFLEVTTEYAEDGSIAFQWTQEEIQLSPYFHDQLPLLETLHEQLIVFLTRGVIEAVKKSKQSSQVMLVAAQELQGAQDRPVSGQEQTETKSNSSSTKSAPIRSQLKDLGGESQSPNLSGSGSTKSSNAKVAEP